MNILQKEINRIKTKSLYKQEMVEIIRTFLNLKIKKLKIQPNLKKIYFLNQISEKYI